MDSADDMLRQIARIEREIEDLLEYRAGLFADGSALTGWASFVAGFKRRMACRQIQRHLQYLRLERETVNHSYEILLKKTGQRQPS